MAKVLAIPSQQDHAQRPQLKAFTRSQWRHEHKQWGYRLSFYSFSPFFMSSSLIYLQRCGEQHWPSTPLLRCIVNHTLSSQLIASSECVPSRSIHHHTATITSHLQPPRHIRQASIDNMHHSKCRCCASLLEAHTASILVRSRLSWVRRPVHVRRQDVVSRIATSRDNLISG